MNLYTIGFEGPDKRDEADPTTMMFFRAESAERAAQRLIESYVRDLKGNRERLRAKLNAIQAIRVYDLATNVDGEEGWAMPTIEVKFDVTQVVTKKPWRGLM